MRRTSVTTEADMKPGNKKGTNPGPPDRTRRTRRTAIVLRTPPHVLTSTAANCGPPFGTKRPQVQILSPRLYSRRSEALTRVGEGLSCCQYSSKIRQVQQRRRDLTCASKGLPQSALLFADRDRRKRSLEPTPQPRVPEHPWPDYRSDVVDGVERSGRGLKQAREHTADAVGQPAKDPNEYQQSDDDQVAEEHVEQQLPVGPLRAIRRPAQVGHRGRVQQMVERLLSLLHLVADDLSVHLSTSLPEIYQCGTRIVTRASRRGNSPSVKSVTSMSSKPTARRSMSARSKKWTMNPPCSYMSSPRGVPVP